MAPQPQPEHVLMCGCGLGSGPGGLHKRQQGLPDATRKWPLGYVFRWRLTGTIPGFNQNTMENIITRGFGQWASISSFRFEKAQGQDVNTHISVLQPNQTDPALPYMGPNQFRYGYGMLGPQGPDGRIYGTFKFNGSRTGPPRWDLTSMYNTFVHEFGHVIGVGHVDPPQALMAWQMYDPSREMRLTDIDITRFRNFYRDPSYFRQNTIIQNPTYRPQQQQQQVQQGFRPQQPGYPNQNYNQNSRQTFNYNGNRPRSEIYRRRIAGYLD
ncbi:hypothetical protein H072_7674 [Dactylellina haptotyla CBS 200.50]|uniref:Peptidase metallopeptidase domain-containing protein n=1 Tax=Dactylellina haptotyla (strain CBS 200.50) TaxID=1284197 RepID=S8BTL0_DACHA|nr:hypothetical protein H072_7674 [Dactylellina haptotyla CBS 200.50]